MKSFKILFAICAVFSMCSCQKGMVDEVYNPTEDAVLKNSLELNDIRYAGVMTSGLVKSRAELSESACKAIVDPLITDGMEIRSEIIAKANADEIQLSAEDLEIYNNLDDEQLALLSFIVTVGNDETVDLNTEYTMTAKQRQIVSCLSVAVGLDTFKKLGVGGLITAQGARQIILAVGKRYLGYVGVALMVYEFGSCMNWY